MIVRGRPSERTGTLDELVGRWAFTKNRRCPPFEAGIEGRTTYLCRPAARSIGTRGVDEILASARAPCGRQATRASRRAHRGSGRV